MSDPQESSFDFNRRVGLDVDSYEILFTSLKTSLCGTENFSSNYLNNVILECQTCIEQCLCVAIDSIYSMDCNVLLRCIEDAICLLQILSNYIKRALESMPFFCSTMKQFPTAIGKIILSVFNHCKSSECVYGAYLIKVERQLKDLFRRCHELQLTYLLTLEKHFIFDLSKTDELNVLLEALDINLQIGDVVQNLDIKTMAEQWKAYTALCGKYCTFVEDKEVNRKGMKLLCEMIRRNMNNVLEMQSDDEKAALRPIKVASFALKIQTKLFNIFEVLTYDNGEIIDLFILLNVHNCSYFELFLEKHETVRHVVEDNIGVAVGSSLTALLRDHSFVNRVCELNTNHLKNENYIGYLILITKIMKIILLKDIKVSTEIKLNIIKRIFYLLPSGHTWFNIGLKIRSDPDDRHVGLFEYTLAISVAFARTFANEEYAACERIMYTSLLGTDCYCALFAADLWLLLMRSTRAELVRDTALSLFKVYKALAQNGVFERSPQKVYLTYVIRNFFKLCTEQDKISILNAYKLQDYFDVWSGLKSSDITLKEDENARIFVTMLNGCVDNDEIENLVTTTNLVMGKNHKDDVAEVLLRLWNDVCPCDCNSVWDNKYLKRLINITEAIIDIIPKQIILKIHNTMGKILKCGDEAVVFLLFQKFCFFYEKHNLVAHNMLLIDVLINLVNKEDEISQYIFTAVEKNYKIDKFIQCNPTLLNIFSEYRNKLNNTLQFKTQLLNVENNFFSHECFASDVNEACRKNCQRERNFDLNIDSLFDDDNAEPHSKKLKLTDTECVDLISKIEANVCRLCELKNVLNHEQKLSLSNVCAQLNNIIDQ